MTVNYKGELSEAREAENDLGVRTYTRAFQFETTTEAEDAWDVGSHASVPVLGSTFRDGWCIRLRVRCVKGWKVWTVTAEYSSAFELNEDPTLDPAKIRVSTEQFQKEAVIDRDGYSVCNSLGDAYDPPLMMDDSRRVIHVVKNMATHPSWLLNYADTTNSDSFTVRGITYTAGQGKFQRASISDEYKRNSVPYFVGEFEIHCQRLGWGIRRLDDGFRERDYELGVVNITNAGDGEEPTAPAPMNGAGVSLASPGSTVNIVNTHNLYQSLPFSVLPFT